MNAAIFQKAYVFFLRLKAGLQGKKIDVGRGCRISSKAVIEAGCGEIRIGRGCRIHPYAVLNTYGGVIELGDEVSVNPFSVLYGHGGLKIGSFVRVAAHVVIIPANHRYKDRKQKIMYQGEDKQGIIIEDDVWIGSGAKILDGAHIAEGCVIGANCVVTGGTEPFGVYAGTPYQKIAEREAF
jgi:acetyltransferase-like isoleucine patch superfamily enzyme